ncbi:Uncharacterized protein TCM_002715 [Theobroma cacao]|uniref:Uncharacterized protein n=1 Tax=Theobroma cacao TaxID=3641 RepID=A0A061DUW9_THECC|nr:Uncharacterized protein TCM_002715 [Theobroma cacao]
MNTYLVIFVVCRNFVTSSYGQDSFYPKSSLCEPSRATLRKKRKNTATTSLFKKMRVRELVYYFLFLKIGMMVSLRKEKMIVSEKSWVWHDQTFRDNILKALDKANQFTTKPYVRSNNGFGNLTIYEGESTSSVEVGEQENSKSKSEEESCDHTNDYKSSDESVKEKLPRHEYLSLGGGMDGNVIQESLISMTNFLPSTMQNVSGGDVNAIIGVSGDDVNAITEVNWSVLRFGFGTPQHNNASIISEGTFKITRSIQNNFGIDVTLGATRDVSSLGCFECYS